MMKKILFSIILLFVLNNCYGQFKLSINVYKDSTLNTYLSDVKINLISSDKKKKCFKINSFGKYEILINNPKLIYSLEITKKRYIPILIKNLKSRNEYDIEVILKKALSVHDKAYKGPSKIVSIKKL